MPDEGSADPAGVTFRLYRYDQVNPTKGERRAFDCGTESLNRWLVERARTSMETRDAITSLLMYEPSMGRPAGQHVVAGYFCVSAGSLARQDATQIVGQGAPDPVPIVLVGRLAVHRGYQGRGLGAELLHEALLSAISGSAQIGARAVLVDVIDDNARSFYTRFGFERSPVHELKYMLLMQDAIAAMGAAEGDIG